MPLRHLRLPGPMLELVSLADGAIRQIPPAFPLTATVAVNPFLGQSGEDRATAAARLARAGGLRLARDRSEIAGMLADGRITDEDLAAAAAATDLDPATLRAAASETAPPTEPLPTVADLLARATGTAWGEFVADRIGGWAAAHYDAGQALWTPPSGEAFASWRAFASRDLTPGIFGLPGFAARVAALPDDGRMAFAAACETLELTAEAAPGYLHRLLVTTNGWGQYLRGLQWQAERDGETHGDAFALLAIALTWEATLLDAFRDEIGDAWAEALAAHAEPMVPSDAQRADLALQEAADRAAERRLAATFATTPETAPDTPPAIQAAFCIDVRSEVFRRALEGVDGGIATIGFAGFFGLPVAHRAAASDLIEARGPVLLSPAMQTEAAAAPDADLAARVKARSVRAWNRFKMASVSAFAFVEAAGPIYVGKLVRDALGRAPLPEVDPTPLLDMPLADRVATAAAVLRAMSLTNGFARLVLIAGHGARVTNAPHASALQCGACGGHAGDVNARLLAGLLNDAEVRAGLAREGIDVPTETRFVAGLHDTVSDAVTLYEDTPAPDHSADLARLRAALTAAALLSRGERAALLPRGGDGADLPGRGGDWAELRPEWGLAGCAAFVAAPRHRSAGRDLGGRAFLHSYDWQADEGFAVLETILTAPVVVASWIALQYHGSALAPEAFGAGNKLLHNVTGGIGVIEGNGGMLRAGLPWQSVHDGSALRHEPVRLAVVVEAPVQAISDVLARHDGLRALFDNGWLSLHAMDGAGRVARRYRPDGWTIATEEAEPVAA